MSEPFLDVVLESLHEESGQNASWTKKLYTTVLSKNVKMFSVVIGNDFREDIG